MRSTRTSDDTLSEQLVRIALEVASGPSARVREAAARSFFDFLGCVSGAEDETASWVREPSARLAVLAHGSDQDDFHLGSITHPGGVIWSAVTACAVGTGGSWNAALEAAVAGV